ncbi:MAG: Asp-tRNA(Asn)/Glu-tRNA(Gln) amidotransferase subunit GatC, partial [Paracoccaceae bacterium]
MSIDVNTAARVAKLARIKVEEADLPALADEFNKILGFIEQLN